MEIGSQDKNVTRVMSQESVMVFILFTNDIQEYSNCIMYTDDSMLRFGRSTTEQLEIDAQIALRIGS